VRILVAHNFYRWPGGEDDIVRRLVGLLEARGHSVRLFAAENPPAETLSLRARLSLAAAAGYSRGTARRLERELDEFEPELAYVQNVFPILSPSVYFVLQRRRVPVLHSIQNFRFVCPNGLAFTQGEVCLRCRGGNTASAVRFRCLHGRRDQSVLYAAVIGLHRGLGTFGRRTGHLLPVNRLLADVLREQFPGATITVLPNCVDTSLFRPREAFGDSVVYLGRLSEEKGVATLLEALAAVNGLRLEVVGDGPLRAPLEEKGARLGGRAVFHGFLAGEARFDVLRRAVALVMPSVSHDACPMAVLEAMAMGVPVVASRRGGLPDLVGHGETGLLFEAGRADELAAALQQLADAPDTVRRMGAAARRRAEEEYDVEVYYRRFLEACALAGVRP
jgi:glycosyltransferase involved in cell wall biosynthesis